MTNAVSFNTDGVVLDALGTGAPRVPRWLRYESRRKHRRTYRLVHPRIAWTGDSKSARVITMAGGSGYQPPK